MNQLTQIPTVPELEARVEALRVQLPSHLQQQRGPRRLSAARREGLSHAPVSEVLKSHLMQLEGLRVEALLLLEQAGIQRRDRSRVVEEMDLSSDLSSDLSEQITEDLPPGRAASLSKRPVEQAEERDLLEELENYVSPLELMERELAELAAQELERAQSAAAEDPLEEALSARATERATLKPEAAPPVRELSLTTGEELSWAEDERQESLPTRKVDSIPPEEESDDLSLERELNLEQLEEAARQIQAGAEPSDPVPAVSPIPSEAPAPLRASTPSGSPRARSRASGQWRRAKLELKGLLLPLTRSPDAELSIYGAGPRPERVSGVAPWEVIEEVNWQGLDWRIIQEQLGPHASISMAPRSFTPRSQRPTTRPVELRFEEQSAPATDRGLPSVPPEDFMSDDSLDVDEAFAEYDEPVSDEELRRDPELVEMTDAYSALEMSLGGPEVSYAPDEFSDRDGIFEDSLAPRVSAHLESEFIEDIDETGSLDELLATNPFDEGEEMVFDFGEDSPLVWTESSPTPLFSEEPTPSPVYQRGQRRQERATQRSAEEPENGKEEQRSGVFGRLFNKS